MNHVRDLRRALLTVLVVAGLGACDGDEPDVSLPVVDASAYAAVLEKYAPPRNVDEAPTVFVVALGEPITLDDQVAIIEKVGDGYDLKFVDEAEVALDTGAEGKPPLDDGLLIGIGTIPAEAPYTVRVEVYRAIDDVTAQLVTLAWRSDVWTISTAEQVDSEAFVNEAFVSDD
jgi:hypothetical protein